MKRACVISGFTLLEIMIVVAIIGVLAGLAVPSLARGRRMSLYTRFINDERVAVNAFHMHSAGKGGYPPEAAPGVIPAGMDEDLRGVAWTQPTVLGGRWDWDNRQFGYTAGVSVHFGDAMPCADMEEVDRIMDDGNLATGAFRERPGGYINVIEF